MTNDSGYSQQDPADSADDWSARQFQINQRLARVRTMVLVKVTAIKDGAGAIAAPGTVNVQPLVKMIDGQGSVTSHDSIFNIPVFRLGGGKNAVICDPVVDDIGWMAVCDRDSSVVVKTKGEAQPGSRRMHDLADGVYMGSILSGVPEQYIAFTSTGMKLADKNGNSLTTSPAGWNFVGVVTMQGNLQLGGNILSQTGTLYPGNLHVGGTVTGDTAVVSGTISLQTHHHLQSGGGNTGPALP